MEKTLILLAGYPATGKTDLAERIKARHTGDSFAKVELDDVKEEFWDTYGFDNAEEKAAVDARALQEWFRRIEETMKTGVQIMAGYPFSKKQKGTLAELSEKYGYRVLTIRLVGDFKVIAKRYRARDLKPTRHLAHIVTHYHKGDVLEDRSTGDDLVDLDTLIERVETRGYGTFELGHTIEVDATNVDAIDYPALLDRIDAYLDDPESVRALADRAGAELTDRDLCSRIDYTLLKPTSTWDQISAVCAEALEYGCASACIPPSYIKRAHEAYPELTLTTVIAFPLGYMTSAAKAAEAADAVANGASEVDMVIDQGMVKARDYDAIEADIRAVREAVPAATLKVIVETCYLAQETKEPICRAVEAAGADFIKTSTGFGTAGAQVEDVALFARVLDGRVKVKASGGVRTREDLARMAAAGADRIGASASPAKVFGPSVIEK